MFKSFFIVEPDPVLSMDLSGALAAEYPAGGTTVVDSLTSIRSFLLAQTPPVCVIINSRAFSDNDCAPLQHVVDQRGHVIVIGSPVTVPFTVHYVNLPFSTEMILGAIMMAATDETVRQPASHV